MLGSLPANSHPQKRRPDGFSAYPLLRESFLKTHFRSPISIVHKLLSLPKSLGLRWSIWRKASAAFSSKAR